MQVQKRLAAQYGLFLDAVEEEGAHERFFALVEPDFLLEFLVVQHGVGEAQHVEHDVELLRARPRQDVLGVLDVRLQLCGIAAGHGVAVDLGSPLPALPACLASRTTPL